MAWKIASIQFSGGKCLDNVHVGNINAGPLWAKEGETSAHCRSTPAILTTIKTSSLTGNRLFPNANQSSTFFYMSVVFSVTHLDFAHLVYSEEKMELVNVTDWTSLFPSNPLDFASFFCHSFVCNWHQLNLMLNSRLGFFFFSKQFYMLR